MFEKSHPVLVRLLLESRKLAAHGPNNLKLLILRRAVVIE